MLGVPSGLPGTSPIRALPLGDGLWAMAAGAPLPEYGGEEIDAHLSDIDWVSDRALAHEAVVEHFAAAHPVLPMKLFTLFTDDERALAALGARRGEIGRALARIAGRVEWGVRILFQETKARRAAAEAVTREEPAGPGAPGASGKSFLLRKKVEQDSARTLTARLRAETDRAYEELARHAAEARRREPVAGEAGARLLLDAAFLVPREDGESFEEAVARWADRLAGQACEITLTGPWPPYNFIEEAP
jgi:methylase of polypeptide subunit release factors